MIESHENQWCIIMLILNASLHHWPPWWFSGESSSRNWKWDVTYL